MKGWRIIPTRLGIGFMLMLIVLLLIAINFSNNLIFTLSFFLAAALLLSAWFVIRNMNGIRVGNIRVKPVHQGQLLDYQISVKDSAGIDHLYLELGENHPYVHLEAYGTRVWHLKVDTDERGIYPQRVLFISCIWPLGLVKVQRRLGILPAVTVYPEAVNLLELKEYLTGSHAHRHSDAEELDGLREYQSGDNINRVDWRAVARRGQLHVKHFDGADGDPSVWLEWQATEGLAYEQRISCLCHWILDCQKMGWEFGLRLPHVDIEPRRGGLHVQECLNRLALMPKEVSL